ncbi:hypothetical protein [Streptomyces sp. NPDC059411]|uniref:hypothetical protein n=1 Tax=Streptomyces sp. NPDC059411 TaxID=3346825 RepID=UPI0036C19B02
MLAVLLATAGCGAGTGTGSGTADHVPSATRTGSLSEAGCVNGGKVVLTADDNGRRVCLDVHGTVRVSLPDAGGAPVTVSGTALAAVSDRVFEGVSAGRAVLTTAVRNCPESAAPGSMSCSAISRWQVTVDVG